MSARAKWINSKVAPTAEALAAGDGCHQEEAKSLIDYLEDNLTAYEAAERIVAPVLQEHNPPTELYRLWALLSETLVELPVDRNKTLDLLSAVQCLSPNASIDWCQLPGFGHMWSDLYRLHLHGLTPWEQEKAALPIDTVRVLRQHLEVIGTAEPEMYVRGIEGVTAEWGYETLNLVCTRRSGLEVYMSRVHAWLCVGGTKLIEEMRPEERRWLSRPAAGSQNGEQEAVNDSVVNHWALWSDTLLELSRDSSPFSSECQDLARECYALMQQGKLRKLNTITRDGTKRS